MNILIIGNGFDLAHRLPTRYCQFLEFCRFIKENAFVGNMYTSIPIPVLTDNNEIKKNHIFTDTVRFKHWIDFKCIVNENFWIDYFQRNRERIGDKWFDFEEEIKNVVTFTSIRNHLYDYEMSKGYKEQNNRINDVLSNYPKLKEATTNKELLHGLLKYHNEMVRAFELFIDGYVNNIKTSPIDKLPQNKYDHVLSFNYSDTYRRLYDSEADCCFIHGKANMERDPSKSDIVLGIENAFEDNTDVEKEVLPFEKYVQRIVKQTDSSYLEWLDVAFDGECNVHIFGHSLGSPDADVLKYFIYNDNERVRERVRTYIYCRDDEDRAEKIMNLAVILGRDKLVKMTSGRRKSIKFIVTDNNNNEENDDGSEIKDA